MQLDISSLKDNKGKSLDFRFEEEISPIDLGGRIIRFHKPVVVEGTAANVESGILVECTIEAVVGLKCDRCLGPVEIIIDTTATEEFVEAKDAGFQGDQGEKEVYTYNGNTIDISKIVEENILLNVPMKVLCPMTAKVFALTAVQTGIGRNVSVHRRM